MVVDGVALWAVCSLALLAAVPTWGAGGLAGCEILTAGARALLERYSGRGLNSGLNSGRRDVNFALACGEQLCEFGLHSTPHAVLAIKKEDSQLTTGPLTTAKRSAESFATARMSKAHRKQ